MAAYILFTYQLVEICLLKLGVHLVVDSRQHYLYAFVLAHKTEVGEVVDARGINKRYLAHSDDTYLRTVTKGCHNLLKTVAGSKEIRTVDLIYLNSLRDGEVLKIAGAQLALLVGVYFVADDLHICGLGHTAHEEKTGDDEANLYGHGQVEDYGKEEGDYQYGDVALRILHQGKE